MLVRLTKNIGRYTNKTGQTGQKILPSEGGLRADHRRSSTAPLVKDAGRRGRRPLRNPIGKPSVGATLAVARGRGKAPPLRTSCNPSVGADAYIGPTGYFPHPRQGTRALPYKMCGGPMCPAATGTSAIPLCKSKGERIATAGVRAGFAMTPLTRGAV